MAPSIYVGFWGKAHVILISAINFLFSICLFQLRNWTTQGHLFHYVRHNLSTVTLYVQFTSAILASSNVYALRQSTNFSRRLAVARQWIPFENFVFWTLLTSGSLDFTLPAMFTALLCLGFGLQFTLAPLWAAAMIPSMTEHKCFLFTVGGKFSNESRPIWDSQFEMRWPRTVWNMFEYCHSVWRDESLYTNCPVPHLNGFLLRAGESSTGYGKAVPKFDNSGFTYKDRSYGAGSGVGIAPGITTTGLDEARVQEFSFTELGYKATVDFIRNSSSILYFINGPPTGKDYPHAYHIYGWLPNSCEGSLEETYPVTSWSENFENMTAWSALYNPDTKSNILSIAAGPGKYSVFNCTQCDIRFEPRAMQVQVNVTSRSFTVKPLHDVNITDPEPSGNHTAAVVRSLNLLSRMTGHLYVSEIGEVLLSSLNGLRARPNQSDNIEHLALTATSNFLTSLVDNILAAYSISQVYIAKDTYPIEIPNAFCEAIRLGSHTYIIATLVVNAAIFCYMIADLLLHQGWRNLPDWDMKKVQDLVYGVLHGGRVSNGNMIDHAENCKEKVLLERVVYDEVDGWEANRGGTWKLRFSRTPTVHGLLLDPQSEELS
ncbi:hypothetical protein F53441_10812 [Fusarium austroafricanum]|uniref:Uncharacterized protein n=1 Tax=Fusarium austroafricanum TaxID=2364996 RepID=A0A8H4NRY1_9HYPO|nr:hypothetical protein F53441_10812 [Fusarium austroafricanum]